MATASVTPQPEASPMMIDVHPAMAHPLSLPPNTPMDTANSLAGKCYSLWDKAAGQAGQAVGAASESLGGPSSPAAHAESSKGRHS